MNPTTCTASTPARRRYFFLPGLLLCFLGLPAGLMALPLETAIRDGDTYAAHRLLQNGADANARVNGVPLFHLSASRGHFDLCRILLWHGADASARDSSNRTALQVIPPQAREALPLQFLLRSYAFLANEKRAPVTERPSRPALTIVIEPTVDYTIPELAERYFVNEAELRGQAGVDDDGNAFIDDVYGWSLPNNAPHEINFMQKQTWSAYRERIEELIGLLNGLESGQLTAQDEAIQRLRSSFSNPIGALFGSSGGFSDFEFLQSISNLSHGSHVAGIVLKASGGVATLHTMSFENFGQEARVQYLIPQIRGGGVDAFLEAFRQLNFDTMVERGRRASDYIRSTGAGVVNGSFGITFDIFVQQAIGVVEQLARHNPEIAANPLPALRTIAYEFYAYNTIPHVLAVAENPNVLFVAAAGNENQNLDETLGSPAYLSRFFPNVITVAASDQEGLRASFSNYGHRSVNITAPGTAIESYGILGIPLLMGGTSMSAPAVAGAAARLRAEMPGLTAAEVRILLEVSSRMVRQWVAVTSTAGELDQVQLHRLARKDPEAIELTAWRVRSILKPLWPEAWSYMDDLTASMVREQPGHVGLWLARAAILEFTGTPAQAREAIDASLRLFEGFLPSWWLKARILSNEDDMAGLLAWVERSEERHRQGLLLGGQPTMRRDMLHLGIAAAFKLGETNRMHTLARTFRDLFGDSTLPAAFRAPTT